MNLNFSGNDLYRGFNLVAGVVPSSAVKNVLKGVKLEAKGNRVELVATDLEVMVRYTPLVKGCDGDGGIVLPAVRVNNVLREWAGNEEILVSVDGSSCTLRSKGGYFKVAGEDAGQFPDVATVGGGGVVEIDGDVLSDMVGRVVHAAAKERTLGVLSGVFVRVLKDDIIMVATDRNRMSCIKRKVSNPDDIVMEGVVAVKCLTFLQRFTSECKGVLKVGMGESRVSFKGERGEVISQLIDGRYPKYDDLIPKGNDKKAEVNRDALLSGVRMASFMTTEGYRVVKFLFRGGGLTLTSKTADVGEAELEVPVNYEGPDFEIYFNPDYIADTLRSSECETVVMEFKDGGSPVVLRSGYEHVDVIMPIGIR